MRIMHRLMESKTTEPTPGKPCVFFDRDGIANVPPTTRYVEKAENFHLYPEFLQALQVVHAKGFVAIMITNQKGISTGHTPQEELDAMHARLRHEAELVGAPVLDIYVCSEPDDRHPDRKPNPGMLLRAAADHQVDLSRSWMVGDHGTDIAAGQRAGCHKTVYVGTKAIEEHPDYRVDHVADLAPLFTNHLPDWSATEARTCAE